MTPKVVTLWYCGFCKKKTFMKYAMDRHERHCTANPDRICLMCEMAQICQQPMADLLKILEPSRYGDSSEGYLPDGHTYRNRLQFDKELRVATEGCPACILAALRQVQPPAEVDMDFKWKEESDAWVRDHTRFFRLCRARERVWVLLRLRRILCRMLGFRHVEERALSRVR